MQVVSILLNKRLVEMQGIMFSAMNHFDLGLQNAEGHDLESSLQKYGAALRLLARS